MSPVCNSPRAPRRALAMIALAALAGCGEANAPEGANAVASAPAAPGRVVHTIAPDARAHAGLVRLLDADAERGRAVMAAAAKGSQAAAGWRKDWRVTADTRRLIAVAAERVAPTADGVWVRTDAVLWDKEGERPLTAQRLFTDPVAALLLVEDAFCAALDAERAEEQGFDRPRSPCPGVEAGHFSWEARGGALVTHLAAHVDAAALGEAGPGYRIAVPVPAGLLPMIRTEYRADFAAGK